LRNFPKGAFLFILADEEIQLWQSVVPKPGTKIMGKYHAYIFASTKRLGHFRKRLMIRSDWAIMAALNLLWERSNHRSILATRGQKTDATLNQEGGAPQ
jgi:hypothetical protein